MRKGAGFLTVAVITAIMVALTSLGVTKVNQAAFGGYNSSRVLLQAQQYAEAEAAVIKATAYSNLVARNKADIQNSNGYKSEITLSAESDYSADVKQRIASINIYKGDESLPRYSLNILKTNAEVQASDGGGVPIGTIIAWASNTAPTEGGTWLLCNGQSCSAYPKLVALIGSTVPDLHGRFLEGTTSTPGSIKSAGLPDVVGAFGIFSTDTSYCPVGTSATASGAFGKVKNASTTKVFDPGSKNWTTYTFDFKASRSNSIYGASSTVQPASYLVNYYIKAT